MCVVIEKGKTTTATKSRRGPIQNRSFLARCRRTGPFARKISGCCKQFSQALL